MTRRSFLAATVALGALAATPARAEDLAPAEVLVFRGGTTPEQAAGVERSFGVLRPLLEAHGFALRPGFPKTVKSELGFIVVVGICAADRAAKLEAQLDLLHPGFHRSATRATVSMVDASCPSSGSLEVEGIWNGGDLELVAFSSALVPIEVEGVPCDKTKSVLFFLLRDKNGPIAAGSAPSDEGGCWDESGVAYDCTVVGLTTTKRGFDLKRRCTYVGSDEGYETWTRTVRVQVIVLPKARRMRIVGAKSGAWIEE